MPSVKLAFEKQARRLPLDAILPVRTVPEGTRKSRKYARIQASVREIGVIEPLVVHPQAAARGESARYVLLDGHLRYDVLRAMGAKDVLCLVSTDDGGSPTTTR